MVLVQDLGQLEEKSIYIIREARTKFKNLAALWSMGKDSTAMLALTRRAFMGKIPFPVIHIDNGIDFPETYKFRDELAKKWKLDMIIGEGKIKPEIQGYSCCGYNKAEGLKKIMAEHGFDALIVSIRRDEHGIRSKERYFSPRDEKFRWNYKDQPAEVWNNYTSKMDDKGHIRVHPLLDWNEADIWNYTMKAKVPMNPLYFSSDGYRFRSLGCTHCTVPTKSNATTIPQIIKELETTKIDERAGRQQTKEKEYIMQKLRALGYM
jgi:sulfate adenylyltransferase subunit 2